MPADNPLNWAFMVGLAMLAIACVALVAYGFSLRRTAKAGTRSLYSNPDTVGIRLIMFGSITALASTLGFVFSLVWLVFTQPS